MSIQVLKTVFVHETVILFASRPRADETQWEGLRALAGGQPVAVAAPARTGS